MSAGDQHPVVIVGGGVSGLSLGWLLADRGIPTVVVEREDRPGGLARSFSYDGFTFDIGPHRFHTEVADVEHILREVLGSHLREISRRSLLQFKGRFYPWPLHPSRVLLRFPPGIALAVVRDLLFGFPRREASSFRDQIITMYGETLYRHFFEGYSSKFLGIPPERTHRDWAKTGVDRAIIDSRLKIQSLWSLIFRMATSWRRPELAFLYPVGGCEQFVRNLADRFQALGGELLCGREVDELEVSGSRIEALRVGDRHLRPSLVVWTGTIHSLAAHLGQPPPQLRYLGLICYNLMLADGEPFDFQWCYHGASDVLFSRVSVPASFDPGNTPHGRRSLCVEVTCPDGNSVTHDPEAHLDRIVADLERERLLRSASEVIDWRVERVPWAYPIYEISYRDRLAAFRELAGRHDNLILGGRLGRFWYNNMDHCIEASLELAEEIPARLARG